MKTINAGGIVSMVFKQFSRVKTRTWVLIGVALASCMALAVWAVIALLGSLWGGTQALIGAAPDALEAARQKVAQHSETLSQVAKEQLAQNLPQLPTATELKAELAKKVDGAAQAARESLGQVAPTLSNTVDQAQQASAEAIAAATTVASAAAIALKDKDAGALPAEAPPARDVSGEDLGPVRYLGLARVAWHSDDQTQRVRYEGRASYVRVLDHYQREFGALGFSQNVVSASAEQETLRFSKDAEVLKVVIARKDALVSVEIESAPRS
jgi:hypothetical protein